MESWTFIYGKNLPAEAKGAVPSFFQCQVMWFPLLLKLNCIGEPAGSKNRGAVCCFVLLLSPICIAYSRILQHEMHSERDLIHCECLQKQHKGGNVLKHSQTNPTGQVYWCLLQEVHVVWARFFWGCDFSRNKWKHRAASCWLYEFPVCQRLY